jgi:UDP-glucose 4-epimerase
MTQGRQTREFNYVEDLVDGLVRAAATPGIEDVSMRDVATLILELMGNPIEAQFGALAYRPTEIWTMRSDSSRARALLGWKPQHSLSDGLEKTIAWYTAELANPTSQFVVR